MILAMVGAVAIADATPRDSASPPDDDFLEFLGSWHAGDDRWTDPFQIDEVPDTEHSERDSDVRMRDDRDKKPLQSPPPYGGPRQPEHEPAVPRRDVKP